MDLHQQLKEYLRVRAEHEQEYLRADGSLPADEAADRSKACWFMNRRSARRLRRQLPFDTNVDEIACAVVGSDSDEEEVDVCARWNRALEPPSVKKRQTWMRRRLSHPGGDDSARPAAPQGDDADSLGEDAGFCMHAEGGADLGGGHQLAEDDEILLPGWGNGSECDDASDSQSDDEAEAEAGPEEAEAADAARHKRQRRPKPADDLLPEPDDADEIDLPPPDSTRLEMINQLQAGLQQQDLQEACHAVMQAAGGNSRQQAQPRPGGDLSSHLLSSASTLSPEAQARLAEAMELVTKELQRFEAEWCAKKLPKLQAKAHQLWHKGQRASRIEEWEWTLNKCKERLPQLVLEVSLQHIDSRQVTAQALRGPCEALRPTKEDLLEAQAKLDIAAGDQPDAPEPSSPPQPKQVQQDVSDPMLMTEEDQDGDIESDSFIVSDDEDSEGMAADGPVEHSAGSKRPWDSDDDPTAQAFICKQQDGSPLFEQAPASDLRPATPVLDPSAVEALKPGAVVEAATGSEGARHIVRAVVLANIPAPVAAHAGPDKVRPCQDEGGVIHWDLCSQRQHTPESSYLLLHWGAVPHSTMTLTYAQACNGGLRQPLDWDAQQASWTTPPEAEMQQLLTLAGHGSNPHEAWVLTNKRRDQLTKRALRHKATSEEDGLEGARAHLVNSIIPRRPLCGFAATTSALQIRPPPRRRDRYIFNGEPSGLHRPSAPRRPRSAPYRFPRGYVQDPAVAATAAGAMRPTDEGTARGDDRTASAPRQPAEPSQAVAEGLKGQAAAAATRKRNRDQKREEHQQARLERLANKAQHRKEQLQRLNLSPLRGAHAPTAGAVPMFPDEVEHFGPQVFVAAGLAKHMKEHQWEGVQFLWKNIYEKFKVLTADEERSGAILAHSMGLGKSFQVIAFLHTLYSLPKGDMTEEEGSRVLLVAPKNVLANWEDEFAKWLSHVPPGVLSTDKVHLLNGIADVRKWHSEHASVLIASYEKITEIMKQKTARGAKNKRKAERLATAEAVKRPSIFDEQPQSSEEDLAAGEPAANGTLGASPDSAEAAPVPAAAEPTPAELEKREMIRMLCKGSEIVVADEGHRLKNENAFVSQCMELIKTPRRIVLTGYPLQNYLREYYVMLRFVGQEDFMGKDEFIEEFVAPVEAGQDADASNADRRAMNKALVVLTMATDDMMHRKGEEVLQSLLPSKHHHVVHLRLTPHQERLYKAYFDACSNRRGLFHDRLNFNLISDMPGVFIERLESLAAARAAQGSAAEEAAAAANSEMLEMAANAAGAEDGLDTPRDPSAPGFGFMFDDGDAGKRGRKQGETILTELAPSLLERIAECKEQLRTDPSPKFQFVRRLLHYCAAHNEKLVIFSENLASLDKLDGMLQAEFGYQPKVHFYRISGNTGTARRKQFIEAFNKKSAARVFLAATRSGGIGINLTSARRCVILDELMNPVHNAQAAARLWRLGQQQEVHVYRLVCKGTLGDKTYARSVDKESLFKRAIDSKTVKGVYTQEDRDWYEYDSPAPLQPEAYNKLREGYSHDPAFKALLEADQKSGCFVVGIADHKENLAEDPTQELTIEEKWEAVQTAASRRKVDLIEVPDDTPAENQHGMSLRSRPSAWVRKLGKIDSGQFQRKITSFPSRAPVIMPAELEDGTELPTATPTLPATSAPAQPSTAPPAITTAIARPHAPSAQAIHQEQAHAGGHAASQPQAPDAAASIKAGTGAAAALPPQPAANTAAAALARRPSSSQTTQLTAEEKALRRKAKKVTGQSPDLPQRPQGRRHSDAILLDDESEVCRDVRGSLAAVANEGGEQEVTSPHKHKRPKAVVSVPDSEDSA
ncbi:hypothetical protein WJX73_008355 [Symbiochloris irregularis]|uniref:Uncharacterized protein n=1 Tax=Symbiochloris irregularis TaxID=706552 RepID=A0AAW1PAE0_9CHLO